MRGEGYNGNCQGILDLWESAIYGALGCSLGFEPQGEVDDESSVAGFIGRRSGGSFVWGVC
jgi:hypothetical protein